MRLLILFSSFIVLSIACKCQTQTTQQAFCAAHWGQFQKEIAKKPPYNYYSLDLIRAIISVSHVKVKVRLTKQPLPQGSARKGLNNIRYAVQHVNVFKVR